MGGGVFTLRMLRGKAWTSSVENFGVAIVGPRGGELLSIVLEPLHSTRQPLFCVCNDAATAQLVRQRWPRTSVLRCDENWLNVLILAAGGAVLRGGAETRRRALAEAFATLELQGKLRRLSHGKRQGLDNAPPSLLRNIHLQ